MGLRTILITAGFALTGTLGLAQHAVTPPANTGGTTATAPQLTVPGQTNVPVGEANAVGVGAGTATTPIPTAIVVPTNTTGFVGPAQSFPLVTTPTITFVNSADGTTTVPVVSYGSGSAMPNSSGSAASAASANTGSPQVADLNLGSVSSVSDLYGGDNRSVAEVARQYKQRRNGVQNARVYTNADIDRIRAQAGEGRPATPASDQSAMPASDQSAEQNNQATTPQVQQPANQKPSPFSPKK
jgi:hypothetical protein